MNQGSVHKARYCPIRHPRFAAARGFGVPVSSGCHYPRRRHQHPVHRGQAPGVRPTLHRPGNNDKEWAEEFPQSLTFTIEGVRFFLIHNKKDVPSNLSNTDVVVYGHSHKYACEERDSVLWLNPGSCGRRRFDQEITFAVMIVDGGHIQVEKVIIPHEKK